MDRDRIALLEWFREFAYADMDKLNRWEALEHRMKMDLVASNCLLRELSFEAIRPNVKLLARRSSDIVAEIKPIQKWFRSRFDEVIGGIASIDRHALKWADEESAYNPADPEAMYVEDPFRPLVLAEDGTYSDINFNIEMYVDVRPEIRKKGRKRQVRWPEDWRTGSSLSIAVSPIEKQEKALFLSFLLTINGLDPNAFMRCQECDQWFFRTSRRRRVFCSSKCAARKANRDRRARDKDVDPDKYSAELRRNSQRARKSYKRKVEKRLGKNVTIGKK